MLVHMHKDLFLPLSVAAVVLISQEAAEIGEKQIVFKANILFHAAFTSCGK